MKIDLSKFDKLSDKQWKDKVVYRGLHIKYKYQLNSLKKLYPEKIGKLQDRFDLLHSFTLKITFQDYGKLVEIYGLDFCLDKKLAEIQPIIVEEIEYLESKIERLTDKYASTLKEIELRDKKIVKRNPKGTIYYIDLTNGNDARTGLKIGPSTIDSTADTTHFVDDFLTGADDYINGSFVWNVTRSAGSLITDFVADTDTVTLADAIPGMTAGDTYYILDAWLTIGKYTTVTARTAGDIAKVRANTTQIPLADIAFDEDGSVDERIEIRGCSIADDPWNDGSDVRPIIDFNSTSYQFSADTDRRWRIYNLEVKNSTDISGAIQLYNNSYGWLIENCKIHDNSSKGIYVYYDTERTVIKDCDFDNNNYSISVSYCRTFLTVVNCTFDEDIRAIYFYTYNSANLIVEDCSFGQSVAITTSDIHIYNELVRIFAKNCKWDKGITYYSGLNFIDTYFEDDNQVFEAHKVENFEAIIERDTVVTRPGGADSSAKITPKSVVGINRVASLSGYPNGYSPNGAFKIWLAADVEKTISLYIRGFGWTGFPTAPQLFIRTNYYGNAGNCIRTQLDSDETISDNTTWVPFQVTLTPARTGFVYVDVIVTHYEASSGVYVDIKPIIT